MYIGRSFGVVTTLMKVNEPTYIPVPPISNHAANYQGIHCRGGTGNRASNLEYDDEGQVKPFNVEKAIYL